MNILQKLFGGGQTANLGKLIEEGAFLVDVREPGEFAAGSVKGAVNIPLGSIISRLNKFKDKASTIVFCRSGARSGQAKLLLEQNGIKNVVNGGGWDDVKRFVH